MTNMRKNGWKFPQLAQHAHIILLSLTNQLKVILMSPLSRRSTIKASFNPSIFLVPSFILHPSTNNPNPHHNILPSSFEYLTSFISLTSFINPPSLIHQHIHSEHAPTQPRAEENRIKLAQQKQTQRNGTSPFHRVCRAYIETFNLEKTAKMVPAHQSVSSLSFFLTSTATGRNEHTSDRKNSRGMVPAHFTKSARCSSDRPLG